MMKELIDLKYQASVTADKPGEVQQSVKTPFNKSLDDIEMITIEQTDSVVRQFSIYPNGCYIYSESVAGSARIRTNFPIEEDENGDLVIIEPKE